MPINKAIAWYTLGIQLGVWLTLMVLLQSVCGCQSFYYIEQEFIAFPLLCIALLIIAFSRCPTTGIVIVICYMLLNLAGAVFGFNDLHESYLQGSEDSHMLRDYAVLKAAWLAVGAWWIFGLLIIAVIIWRSRRQETSGANP